MSELTNIPVLIPGYDSFLANNTVEAKFTDSQVFAEKIRTVAMDMLSNLDGFDAPDLNYLDEDFNYELPEMNFSPNIDLPSLTERLEELKLGDAPLFPDDGLRNEILEGLRGIDFNLDDDYQTEMPTFTVSSPELDLPVIPGLNMPDEPGNPPSINDIEIPDSPEYLDPAYEDLSIAVPDIPSLNVPGFEGSAPDTSSLQIPGNLKVEYDEGYLRGLQDEFLLDIEDKLRTKVNESLDDSSAFGLSGLPPEVEKAIYERAKLRQKKAVDEKKQELQDTFAQRGFMMPPGGMLAAWQKLDVEGLQNEADLNVEIIKQQLEAAKEGFNTTLQKVMDLRKSLLDRAEMLAKYGVDEARYAIDLKFKEFEAAVQKKQIENEEFKNYIHLYGEKVNSERIVLESYKAQLEKSRIEASLKEVAANIFAKKIDINRAKAEVYRSAVEAAKAQGEIEQTKLETYNSKIRAYATKVQAESEKYNAYRAKIAGEQSKVDAFKAQADAYGSEVRAWSEKARAKTEENKIFLESKKALVDQYRSEMELRKVDIEQMRAEVDAQIKQYTGEIALFQASVQAEQGKIEAQSATTEAYLNAKRTRYESLINQARANMDSAIQSSRITSEIATQGANIASQLSSSAMTAVSASAQMSGQQSESVHKSYSSQVSRSDGVHIQMTETA